MAADYLKDLNAQIVRSGRKTVGIQPRSDGSLVIRAPYSLSDTEIEKIILANLSRIRRAQRKARERAASAEESGDELSFEELQELSEKACRIIPERVKYYAPKVGVSYGRITIRSQRTRWGSCSSKGNLNFNCLLMLAPPEALDSVVVRELCHRKEMNHSERFYAEVLRVFPDYGKWNKWLKDNGPSLMAKLPK